MYVVPMPGLVVVTAVMMSRQPGPCGLVNSPWWYVSTQSEKERFMPPTQIPGIIPGLLISFSLILWDKPYPFNKFLLCSFTYFTSEGEFKEAKSALQEGVLACPRGRWQPLFCLIRQLVFSADNPALVVAGLLNSTLVVVWGCKPNQQQKKYLG